MDEYSELIISLRNCGARNLHVCAVCGAYKMGVCEQVRAARLNRAAETIEGLSDKVRELENWKSWDAPHEPPREMGTA